VCSELQFSSRAANKPLTLFDSTSSFSDSVPVCIAYNRIVCRFSRRHSVRSSSLRRQSCPWVGSGWVGSHKMDPWTPLCDAITQAMYNHSLRSVVTLCSSNFYDCFPTSKSCRTISLLAVAIYPVTLAVGNANLLIPRIAARGTARRLASIKSRLLLK